MLRTSFARISETTSTHQRLMRKDRSYDRFSGVDAIPIIRTITTIICRKHYKNGIVLMATLFMIVWRQKQIAAAALQV